VRQIDRSAHPLTSRRHRSSGVTGEYDRPCLAHVHERLERLSISCASNAFGSPADTVMRGRHRPLDRSASMCLQSRVGLCAPTLGRTQSSPLPAVSRNPRRGRDPAAHRRHRP
jgi:hypothetical protein